MFDQFWDPRSESTRRKMAAPLKDPRRRIGFQLAGVGEGALPRTGTVRSREVIWERY
jgi:hypothetical protein